MVWFDIFDYYTGLSTCQGRHTRSGSVNFGTTLELQQWLGWFCSGYLKDTLGHGGGNCITSTVNQQATILLKECMCASVEMGRWWEKCNTITEKHEGGRWKFLSGQWLGEFIWRNYSLVNEGFTLKDLVPSPQQPLPKPRKLGKHQAYLAFGVHYESKIWTLGGPFPEWLSSTAACAPQSLPCCPLAL